MTQKERRSKLPPKEDIFLGTVIQPKREICTEVKALLGKDVEIPRILGEGEVEEILRKGGECLARSEHPDEYNGHASGIFHTFFITTNTIDGYKYIDWKKYQEDHDISTFLRQVHASRHSRFSSYSRLLGLDPNEYLNELTFSYWEFINGLSLAINADSSIEGRHHISIMKDSKNWAQLVSEKDSSKITPISSEGIIQANAENIKQLIYQYELIRGLPIFDPTQCPIMEFQLGDDGKLYFLQYHRTRSFSQATFTIENPQRLQKRFVRGATPRKGIDVPTIITSMFNHASDVVDYRLISGYPGNCSVYVGNMPFQTWLSPQLQAQFITDDFARRISYLHKGHLSRSALFKPNIVIEIPLDEILYITEGHRDRIILREYNNGYTEYIETAKLHVVSDGNNAIVTPTI